MIRPRDFRPHSQADARALDRIIRDNRFGNVQLSDDYIMVAESTPERDGNDPVLCGVIVARPVLYMHEFVIAAQNLANRRHIGELLIAHALSKGAMLGERTAHFSVDESNVVMQNFIEQFGAVAQKPGRIYSLEISPSYYPYKAGVK